MLVGIYVYIVSLNKLLFFGFGQLCRGTFFTVSFFANHFRMDYPVSLLTARYVCTYVYICMYICMYVGMYI
jgi:hypothetical protein